MSPRNGPSSKVMSVKKKISKPKPKAKRSNEAYGEVNKDKKQIPQSEIAELTAKGPGEIRIAAWNVGSLRATLKSRMDLFTEFLQREDPDILGLMEIKINDNGQTRTCEQEIRDALKSKKCGWELGDIVWNMCKVKKGYSGTCVLLKQSSSLPPPLHVSYGVPLTPKNTDEEGRTICLEFPNFFFVLCYVPNSGQTLGRLSYRQEKFDPQLGGEIQNLREKGKPVVLAGDLNVAHMDVDIWNVDAPHIPKSAGTTDEERESFQTVYLDQGMVDSFRHFHPSASGWFSYWSVRAGNKPLNRGLRLDYVLVSEDLLGEGETLRCVESQMLPDYAPGGDHCPVLACFVEGKATSDESAHNGG